MALALHFASSRSHPGSGLGAPRHRPHRRGQRDADGLENRPTRAFRLGGQQKALFVLHHLDPLQRVQIADYVRSFERWRVAADRFSRKNTAPLHIGHHNYSTENTAIQAQKNSSAKICGTTKPSALKPRP
jgi:hypothetical protein